MNETNKLIILMNENKIMIYDFQNFWSSYLYAAFNLDRLGKDNQMHVCSIH